MLSSVRVITKRISLDVTIQGFEVAHIFFGKKNIEVISLRNSLRK